MKIPFLRLMFVAAVGCSAASQNLGNSDKTDVDRDPNAPADPLPAPTPVAGDEDGGSEQDASRRPPSPPQREKDASSVDAPPEPPIVPDAKRVFETSGVFSGDLKSEGAGATGVEGADNLCAGAALAAGLGGTWKAWISAPGENAADRIADLSPWYLVDRRTKVFEKKLGLGPGSLLPQAAGVKVGPLVDIRMNELGAINSPKDAWTGTTKTGIASGFTCNGWTNAQPVNGYEGLVGIGISVDITWWTDSATNPCRLANRLMCFEQ